ncbi:MAG: phosphatidate cytidylyltransferase [Syntrophaceae bacterium]|nr:phosphatidate cytidylyltransferase [Syntrophaceae bacterium]
MAKIEKRKVWMALIMVPPILFLIGWGPSEVLHLMVVFATFLGLREYYRLVLPQSKWIEHFAGIGLGLMLSLFLSFGDSRELSPFLFLVLILLSIFFMVTSKDLASTISKISITLFGILYVGFLLAYVSLIRNLADGRLWVLFLVATIWAGDISALLSGSFLGKHKLYPKISPNKTVEGLGGAIVGSIIIAFLFAWVFLPYLEKGHCLFLAIGLGILGQFGDFTESMLKRSAQVKDSGTLIPGHGGMLDRLDSFLFSAPFLHYSLLYLFKEAP